MLTNGDWQSQGTNIPDSLYTQSINNFVKTYTNINGTYTPWKYPVRWVSTESDIPLTGEYTTPSSIGTRILVTAQTDPVQNGIYLVSEDDWERSDDMRVGTSAGGSYIIVADSAPKIFFCTTAFEQDIVGTNELTFIQGISNDAPTGIQGSVQYMNASFNSFEGSPYLIFEKDLDNLLTKLTIGDGVFDTYIIPSTVSPGSNGIDMSIQTENNPDASSGNINIKAGQGTGSLINNGSVNIDAGMVDISTYNGGNITFFTGNSNRESNINFTCNALTISTDNNNTDNGKIGFISNDIPLYFKKGNLLTTKTSTTVAYPDDIEVDSKQGIVNITNLGSIGASSSGTIVLVNTYITATSMIYTNILSSASGTPLVKVYRRISGQAELKIINIDTVASLGNTTVSFIII